MGCNHACRAPLPLLPMSRLVVRSLALVLAADAGSLGTSPGCTME